MAKIILQGTITVPDKDLVAFNNYLSEHRKLTSAEPGCELFRVEQRPDDCNVFDVYERFVDREAFHLHKQRMELTNWSTITKSAIRDYKVQGFD